MLGFFWLFPAGIDLALDQRDPCEKEFDSLPHFSNPSCPFYGTTTRSLNVARLKYLSAIGKKVVKDELL